MTVVIPFSTDHMDLVRPLPEATPLRLRAASEWVEIALPRLRAHARGRAWRRGVDRQEFEDVVAAVLLRIHERVLKDHYAEPLGTVESTRLVLDHVDHFIRSWTRRARREADAVASVGEAADRLADGGIDPLEACAGASLARNEAALIRGLPDSAVRRLVVLLHVHPEQVVQADVAAAVSKSRRECRNGQLRVLGLSRDLEEVQRLLGPWLLRGKEFAETRAGSPRRAVLRLWLAWILRGPAGSEDIGTWDEAEMERGQNWLDQQLSRGRRSLRAVLGETGSARVAPGLG